jgi:hypothetical protein
LHPRAWTKLGDENRAAELALNRFSHVFEGLQAIFRR